MSAERHRRPQLRVTLGASVLETGERLEGDRCQGLGLKALEGLMGQEGGGGEAQGGEDRGGFETEWSGVSAAERSGERR